MCTFGEANAVMNIVLVDDVQETLDTLEMMYRWHTGVRVVGKAKNASELWEILGTRQVDVVSVDIELGGQNGLDLCQEISHRYPKVFIVVCSVEDSEDNRRRAAQAGAKLFLGKPVARGDVGRMIETYRQAAGSSLRRDAVDSAGKDVDFINLLNGLSRS